MANTRLIKRRIVTAQNISKITKAMEMVAASKMKKAQAQALSSRAFARAIEDSLKKVAAFTNSELHPLLSKHQTGTHALVLVSTNKGLCGGLNTNLFKNSLHWHKTHDQAQVIAIGKKAVTFAQKMGWDIAAQFTELPETLSPKDTLPISSLIMDKFLKREFRSVQIVYMDFINTISQETRVSQLLPIAAQETPEDDLEIIPSTSKEYLFEPTPHNILNSLLPYYIENNIYQVLLEAKASEHSARMVAMKNASDNAVELVDELKLDYNKSRQAAITEELRDIATAGLTVN